MNGLTTLIVFRSDLFEDRWPNNEESLKMKVYQTKIMSKYSKS